MSDALAKVIMLDRTTYNNRVAAGTIENDAIYFVREGSANTASMLSLYVGLAKQCELVDISDDAEVEFDNVTNLYTIPEKYHVPEKMFFFQQNIVSNMEDATTPVVKTVYHLCMWDATNGRFVDCSGIPNNVIVCTNGQLPRIDAQHSEAIKDYVYIDVMNRNIYVFDGNAYIPILNLSQYATKEWVQDYHNTHPIEVAVDDLTIRKTSGNVLYGAGADMSGKAYPPGTAVDEVNGIHGALKGAHIFNDYTDGYPNGNIAYTGYTSVFGYSNTESYPTYANAIANAYLYGSNIIGGYQNTVGGLAQSTVVGKNNSVSVTDVPFSGCAVFGRLNNITGSGELDIGYVPAISCFGYYNSISSVYSGTDLNASFVGGWQNGVTVRDGKTHFVFGIQNSLNTTTNNNGGTNCLIGYLNQASDASGVFASGYQNKISGNNSQSSHAISVLGSDNSLYGKLGEGITVIGHLNTINENSGDIAGTNVTITNTSIIGSNSNVNCSVGSSVQSISGCCLIGDNVAVDASNLDATSRVCVGIDLTNKWNNSVVIGCGNDVDLPYSVSNPSVIIGNEYVDQTNSWVRRNVAVVDRDTNNTISYGNIINKSTDMSMISSIKILNDSEISFISSGVATLSTLPSNGDDTILITSDLDDTVDISSINFTSLNISIPYENTTKTVSTVKDYCATIVFKPTNPISDVTTLLNNFDPSSQNRIYLMNPTVDISTYNVIHLLLFYDGFNVCCTVAGYEESVPV